MTKFSWNRLAAFSALAVAWFSLTSVGVSQTRDEKVLSDRDNLVGNDAWIYNDLESAQAQAIIQKKPLLVLFRCIP